MKIHKIEIIRIAIPFSSGRVQSDEINQDFKAGNKNSGLFASVNLTLRDKATNNIRSSQQAVLWYKGTFNAPPNASINLGIIHFHVNDRLTDRQKYSNTINQWIYNKRLYESSIYSSSGR